MKYMGYEIERVINLYECKFIVHYIGKTQEFGTMKEAIDFINGLR